MKYESDWSCGERGWFDRWVAFEKDSGFANRVVTGMGAFLNYPEDSLSMIRRVLAPSARGNQVLGVAIYSYAATSVYGTSDFYNSADLYSGLPRQPYGRAVTTPAAMEALAHAFNPLFIPQLS